MWLGWLPPHEEPPQPFGAAFPLRTQSSVGAPPNLSHFVRRESRAAASPLHTRAEQRKRCEVQAQVGLSYLEVPWLGRIIRHKRHQTRI